MLPPSKSLGCGKSMNLLILASITFVVSFDYFAHLKQMKVVHERCQFILAISKPLLMCPNHVKSRNTPKVCEILNCLVIETIPINTTSQSHCSSWIAFKNSTFSMSHFFLKNQKLKFSFFM